MACGNETAFAVSPEALAILVSSKSVTKFHDLGGLDGLASALHTDCVAGLPDDGNAPGQHDRFHRLRAVFGANRLPERKSLSLLQLILRTLNDKVLIILSVIAAISLAVGLYQSLSQEHAPGESRLEWVEGVTIMVAVLIVVLAGALNDWQKEKQFARLSNKKDDRTVKAIRSGRSLELSVYDVVVGDVLHVEPGDVITADGVLISCYNVRADESSVTGETDQIKKTGPTRDAVDPFLVSGSKILEGMGTYLVLAVGPHSTYGRLRMALSERTEPTPLQSKLSDVADKLARGGIAIAMLLFLMLTIQLLERIPRSDDTAFEHLQTFLRLFIVSLAVIACAVPEGLPLAVALALAIAVTRMLRDNNLVRTLSACETMGNATTVCCDKTGTLTTNAMTVTASRIGMAADGARPGPFAPSVREVLVASIAINSTAFEDGPKAFIGSKTESALLSFARDELRMGKLGEERARATVVDVAPFDSGRKSMASVIAMPNGTHRLYVKGAPELLLSKSNYVLSNASRALDYIELTHGRRQSLLYTIHTYSTRSLRTLGVAYRDFSQWPPPDQDDDLDACVRKLTFLGVFAIQDPLRPGVAAAVAACRNAGVCVRMVTGDNVATARAIATQCGILTPSGLVIEGPAFRSLAWAELDRVAPRVQVLARSSPEDKAALVKKLKELGETVAVTGDGTNDGLALRAADVGFSMGLSGTEIAKEASDIVLLDDNIGSLVQAIKWGRSVNDIIKKFLQFQLTVSVTAMIVTFTSAATSSKEESVLTPVQLLWINLIMDTFAALALATEPPDPSVLERQPDSRSAPLIPWNEWKFIAGQSLYQLIVILTLHFGGPSLLHYPPSQQESLDTLVFNTFVWMQLFNLYNCRRLDDRANVFKGISRNGYFIAITVAIVVGQVLIIFFGGSALSTVPLSAQEWGISLGLGAFSLPVGILIRTIPGEPTCSAYSRKNRASQSRIGNRDNHADRVPQVAFLQRLRQRVVDAVRAAAARMNISSPESEEEERRPLL